MHGGSYLSNSPCTLSGVERSDVAAFAGTFQRFLEAINELVPAEDVVPLRTTLEAHLGRDAQELPMVADRYRPFEHVNVQVALEAWFEEPRRADGPG